MEAHTPPSNSQELAELYRRFGPSLHRRALSLLRDPEEAVDVTQDTFLDFMRVRGTLRGKASPFTVLYQMVTYKAVDRLRRRSRWTGSLELKEEDVEAAEQRLEAATAHEGGLERVEVAQDLALLTEGESPEVLTVALLYYVEGHTTEELGRVLGLHRKVVAKMLEQFAKRARARQARLVGEVGQ